MGQEIGGLAAFFRSTFDRFVENKYRPFLDLCLQYRYITLSAAVALLLVVGGFGYSGHMGLIMMPEVAADEIEPEYGFLLVQHLIKPPKLRMIFASNATHV
ncbi:hypothetical protein Q2T40_05170 [Winogradskyella maritima]|nr:hypothetical protein [Winogradskyella maritima]